jgi:hypothetical protein
VLLASCDSKKPQPTRVQAFSIGQSALNDNSKLLYNYGGYAIRIDDGTAVLRMFRISNGKKVQEFEQVLDSSKHPMAWITPRVSGSDVEVEFGRSENNDDSQSIGVAANVHFASPHKVGSGEVHSALIVEDVQQELLHYWVMKNDATDFSAAEDGSEATMLRTSEAKPLEFLLVTIAKK